MSAGRLLVGKGKWGPIPLLPQGTQRLARGQVQSPLLLWLLKDNGF